MHRKAARCCILLLCTECRRAPLLAPLLPRRHARALPCCRPVLGALHTLSKTPRRPSGGRRASRVAGPCSSPDAASPARPQARAPPLLHLRACATTCGAYISDLMHDTHKQRPHACICALGGQERIRQRRITLMAVCRLYAAAAHVQASCETLPKLQGCSGWQSQLTSVQARPVPPDASHLRHPRASASCPSCVRGSLARLLGYDRRAQGASAHAGAQVILAPGVTDCTASVLPPDVTPYIHSADTYAVEPPAEKRPLTCNEKHYSTRGHRTLREEMSSVANTVCPHTHNARTHALPT